MNAFLFSALAFLVAGCSLTFNFGTQTWYDAAAISTAPSAATKESSGFDMTKYLAVLLKMTKNPSPADVKLSEKETIAAKTALKALGCGNFDKEVRLGNATVARHIIDVSGKELSFPAEYGDFLAVQYEYVKRNHPQATFECLSDFPDFGKSTGFAYTVPDKAKTGFIFGIEENKLTPAGTIRGKENVSCTQTGCDLLLLQYLLSGSTETLPSLLKTAVLDE